jgi:hypothetical protein
MESISVIIIPIIVIVGFIILVWLLPSKGKIGEKRVANKLDKLPKDKYRVLNDVMLRTQNGTSQIDHIVVSVYGVFVIETKFYQGWIYGGENSEYWTQNIYGNKRSFYNPILQNAGHVRVLQRALKDFGDLFIYPIVTFSGQADLKVNVSNACVIYWNQILTTIRHFTKERLTWKQVNEICNYLDSIKLNTKEKETLREHGRDIHNAKEKKYDALSSGRCPRCGGALILREGKYGKFYGCSNYPKCKFTHEA